MEKPLLIVTKSTVPVGTSYDQGGNTEKGWMTGTSGAAI